MQHGCLTLHCEMRAKLAQMQRTQSAKRGAVSTALAAVAAVPTTLSLAQPGTSLASCAMSSLSCRQSLRELDNSNFGKCTAMLKNDDPASEGICADSTLAQRYVFTAYGRTDKLLSPFSASEPE